LGNSACRQDRKSTCCEKCTCSIQSHNYLHETKGATNLPPWTYRERKACRGEKHRLRRKIMCIGR
jgi:hypothetical protein